MSINIAKFNKLNELVSLEFRRKHTIVLNPDKKEDIHEEDIIYDKANWKITDELKKYVDELSQNNDLSIEDKIIYIYEKICKDYVYDDNLISYIKKIDEDVFSIPDWYGRDVDQEWEKNRENHNRRICFELSRYLAKALDELLRENKNYDVCILWNKNLTHYFVGLTSNEYTLALDVDDFFNIKDLTRVKADLTIEGIQILEDNKNKFKNALENTNSLKIGQNIKYDYIVLRNYGITVKGKFFDTMVAHYLLQPEQRHNMDYLAEVYLKYKTVHIEELIGPKGKNQLSMRQVPIEKISEYAAEDADITLKLKNVFEKEVLRIA